MIKNDEMFKYLFYLYYFLRSHENVLFFQMKDDLECNLKDYLMYNGYNNFHDLDLLLLDFIERGRI